MTNRRGKKIISRLIITLAMIGIIWALPTLWVEQSGPKRSWQIGQAQSETTALIVYDPDPLYNLDEQICSAFGEGLARKGISVTIATVAAAEEIDIRKFSFYVLCANTYNWRPDWSISNFLNSHLLDGKPVVAITLGSGSTRASQAAFEKIIRNSKGNIVDSRSLWLMKPNDEERMDEPNVVVAKSISFDWAAEVADELLAPK